MITHLLIDQFVDTGIARVPIVEGRSIPNARALLRGVGMTLGAKVRTRAAEHQRYQGVTQVIGEIEHGPVDDRGCYICRQTGSRLARIAWLWAFDDPVQGCAGSVRRVLNDDPEQGLELSTIPLRFADATRAAGYLTDSIAYIATEQ